jgi:hypothetical protein
MASDPHAPRSRRALLTAAAGGAAAVAASAAMPLTAAAADPNDVVKNVDNPTTAQTSITQSAAGFVAFKASTTNPDRAGLVGATGDETDIRVGLTQYTGVYGWSPEAPFPADPQFEGSGVWGDSPDDGVVGTGGLTGVLGIGGDGVIGVGDFDGVVGVGGPSGAGVRALGATATAVALAVTGKVAFSRSGRSTIGTGKSSLKITLPGTTSSSRVFAVLHSNRSGRYVRAVVPTTGSFTIYLNTTVTSATFVAWFVLN